MEHADPEGKPLLEQRGFQAAVAFAVAVAVGGVWLVMGNWLSSPEPDSSSIGAPAATAALSEAASDSVCGLAVGDQQVPTTTPSTSEIVVGQGLSVPSLDGVGPGVVEGISRCFAPTPTGALLAAINFMTWFSSSQQLPQVIELLTVPGSDQDRALEEVAALWDGTTSEPVEVTGFKLEVRSGGNEVVVDLAVSLPSDLSQAASWPLVMAWVDGDWKVRILAGSDWGVKGIVSLSGEEFVPWVRR